MHIERHSVNILTAPRIASKVVVCSLAVSARRLFKLLPDHTDNLEPVTVLLVRAQTMTSSLRCRAYGWTGGDSRLSVVVDEATPDQVSASNKHKHT